MMISFKKYLLTVLASGIAVVILILIAAQVGLTTYTIHDSAKQSLRYSAHQLSLTIETAFRGYSTTVSNIAESPEIIRFIIDYSDINLASLKYLLQHRKVIDHQPEYAVLDYSGAPIHQTHSFIASDKHLDKILKSYQKNSLERFSFVNTEGIHFLLVIAPVRYLRAEEGYLIAQIPSESVFRSILAKLNKNFSARVIYSGQEITRLGQSGSFTIKKPIPGIPELSAEVSLASAMITEPLTHSFLILAGLGVFIFLISTWLTVQILIPKLTSPLDHLGKELSDFKDITDKTIHTGTHITEIQVLENRFNKMIKHLDQLYNENMQKAHKAGMAEISISVLHNIGNVITSMNMKLEGKGPLSELQTLANHLRKYKFKVDEHLKSGTLQEFLTQDPKGKQYGDALIKIADRINQSAAQMENSKFFYRRQLTHVSEIISAQQSIASGDMGIKAKINIKPIVINSLNLLADRFEQHNIVIQSSINDATAHIDRYGFSQVIVNFLVNAIEAISERQVNEPRHLGQINVYVGEESDKVKIQIADNGIGIDPNIRKNLFVFGFSTKNRPSGFGLHNCANYVKANGGQLDIESDGKMQGATSVLEFPKSA